MRKSLEKPVVPVAALVYIPIKLTEEQTRILNSEAQLSLTLERAEGLLVVWKQPLSNKTLSEGL